MSSDLAKLALSLVERGVTFQDDTNPVHWPHFLNCMITENVNNRSEGNVKFLYS